MSEHLDRDGTRCHGWYSPSGMKGRIGILGGSFDPLHIGHMAAARACRSSCSLDCVVFLPTHKNPLKKDAPVAGDAERFKMIKAGVEEEDGFSVWDLELAIDEREPHDRPSYTADTLAIVRAQVDASAELFLLIGSDLIPQFPRWKDWRKIIELATIVPFQREGYFIKCMEKEVPGLGVEAARELQSRLIKVPEIDISATKLREILATGSVPEDMLPAGVADYLRRRNPYRSLAE